MVHIVILFGYIGLQAKTWKRINQLTHMLENSSSCINLVFMSHPDMVLDSGGSLLVTTKF